MKNKIKFVTLGAIALLNLSVGLEAISEGVSKRNAVREAVYARAENITTETINRANKLAEHTGTEDYILGAIAFGTAGFMGLAGYSFARKIE